MVRGFSTTMSNIIFFIGAIVAASLALTAMGYVLKQLQASMEVKASAQVMQTQTILTVADTGYDVNDIWVYVKNIGKTNLDVNSFDVFVNGAFFGTCNSARVRCTDETGNYVLTPGEIMDVNISYPNVPAGSYRVRVVSQYGAYAEGEVVVG